MNIQFTYISLATSILFMPKSKKLIIFGSGTLAELADFYFTNDSEYEVSAFVEDDDYDVDKTDFLGRPLYKWSDVLIKFNRDDFDIFIAIGYQKTNSLRRQRFDQVRRHGYRTASYISSKAINFASKIGSNCFILEANVLQPFSQVGDCVTMWSGNHLGHHSVIEDNCFITSHVVISGKCVIGSSSFIGVNVSIHDGVHLGGSCVVGAGSIVAASCESRSVFSPTKTESRVIARDVI